MTIGACNNTPLINSFCTGLAIAIASSIPSPSQSIPALTRLDIDLLTHCVLLGETSRLEAMREFRQRSQAK